MKDSTARMVSTVGIWVAVAGFLSVLVWRDATSPGVVIPVVAIGFAMATGATASVWKSDDAGVADPAPTYPTNTPGRVI